MGIKIVKEKKAMDYTFTDNSLNPKRQDEKKESDVKKDKTQRNFRFRDDAKVSKLKHKSKVTSGHSMQGHSPVYE